MKELINVNIFMNDIEQLLKEVDIFTKRLSCDLSYFRFADETPESWSNESKALNNEVNEMLNRIKNIEIKETTNDDLVFLILFILEWWHEPEVMYALTDDDSRDEIERNKFLLQSLNLEDLDKARNIVLLLKYEFVVSAVKQANKQMENKNDNNI